MIELPFDKLRVVRQRERNAFTLIELLVVIAIISLLVTLLVPSLRQAKQLAVRTLCLTTVRTLAQGMGAYAAEHNDERPLGYAWNQKWTSDRMYGPVYDAGGHYWPNPDGSRGNLMFLGCLYPDGFVREKNLYFCPAEPKRYSLYPTQTVVAWPPVGWGTEFYPDNNVWWLSAGYCVRPSANWEGSPRPGVPVCHSVPPKPMPKGTDKQAIISEIISYSSRVWLKKHVTGMNVGYGNGSARFVAMDYIVEQAGDEVYDLTSTTANTELTEVWKALDSAP